MQIKWLGHASFELKINKLVLYIDPYEGEYTDKADIILISHFHYDHCSLEKIKKIRKEDTTIIGTPEVASQIYRCRGVSIGEEGMLENIRVLITPAYNLKDIGEKTHTKENSIGYLIKTNGKKIYYAGSTDLIPEMSQIKADIVLLPVGGTYTMSAEQAAKAAKLIKPKIAIPMHYGKTEGTRDDALYFKELAEKEGITVKIMEQEKWEKI